MWQIDSFEGGKWSRAEFLLSIATRFEKENKNVYINVCSRTIDQANELIKKGEYPDIISYGNGVEIDNFFAITSEKSFLAGEFDKRQVAIPWCNGKYLLIYNKKLVDGVNQNIEELIVSKSDNTLPLIALIQEELTVKNLKIMKPLDAYKEFLKEKTPYFLGTQRDIVRLTNRFIDYGVYPINGFNDLYQYLSITTTNQTKIYYINAYINFLLSKPSQKELYKISMFSPYYTVDFLEEELNKVKVCENRLTISPFFSKEKIKELHTLSFNALMGDENAKIKLKEDYYCKI